MTPTWRLTIDMEIIVNGQPRELEPGATVATLLETLGLDPRQLAVERNLELVPRAAHAKTALDAGDRIEVVTLVGGG
jgi:thiamine biosynthesis protein ThiS